MGPKQWIHTDSIKENIVPTLTEKHKQYLYANEAGILNVALFGITAKEWKDKNPNLEGNMRDQDSSGIKKIEKMDNNYLLK